MPMRPPSRCSTSLGRRPRPGAICGCTEQTGRMGRLSCSMSISPAGKRSMRRSSWRAFPGFFTRTATRATISCPGTSGWLAAGPIPGGSSMRRLTPCRRTSGRARQRSPGWNIATGCSPGRNGSKNSPPEERTKQRLKEEKPILDAFLAWADSVSAAPKSALSKALHYLKEQWPYLLRYLEDGRLELSNNRAERSIKPFVIGRKNFLFANTPLGAQASAVIYSLIETAKETGLDPFPLSGLGFGNRSNPGSNSGRLG